MYILRKRLRYQCAAKALFRKSEEMNKVVDGEVQNEFCFYYYRLGEDEYISCILSGNPRFLNFIFFLLMGGLCCQWSKAVD